MSTQIFSIREVIKVGWELTKKHFWLMMGVMVFAVIMQVIPQGVQFLLKNNTHWNTPFWNTPLIQTLFFAALILVFFVINLVISVGTTKLAIKIIRYERASFKELFINYNLVVKYFLASLLYGFIVVLAIIIPLLIFFALFTVGFFVLAAKGDPIFSLILSSAALPGAFIGMIPGIYFSVKYWYYPYFVVDQNLGAVAALKKSGQATHGIKSKLCLLWLALGLVNLLGVLALGVGIFVSLAVTALANAYVYNALSKRV